MKTIQPPKKSKGQNIKLHGQLILNADNQTFTFSFEYVQKDYCFEKLEKNEKITVVNSLFKRREMSWRQIRHADRHGMGIEEISKESLKASIPNISLITPDTIFHAMRFDGKKPMVGFRFERIFYILWFDRSFKLYKH